MRAHLCIVALVACRPPFDAPRPEPACVPEICGNDIDEDCDGVVLDCATSVDDAPTAWYGSVRDGWLGDTLATTGSLEGTWSDAVLLGGKGTLGGAGAAVVYSDLSPGSRQPDAAQAVWISQLPLSRLGSAVVALPDPVDPDRHAAFVVAAFQEGFRPGAGPRGNGAVYVVSGEGPATESTPEGDLAVLQTRLDDGVRRLRGAPGSLAGMSMAAGRVGQASTGDLAVGASGADELAGAVYLLRSDDSLEPGDTTLAESAWATLAGAPGEHLGCAVAALSGVADDGSDAVLATGCNAPGTGDAGSGAAYLFRAATPGVIPTAAHDVRLLRAGSEAGMDVAADHLGVTARAGDLTGDGLDDAVLVAHGCGFANLFLDIDGYAEHCELGANTGPTSWYVVDGGDLLAWEGDLALDVAATMTVHAPVNHTSCHDAVVIPGLPPRLAIGYCPANRTAGQVIVFDDNAGVIVLGDDAPLEATTIEGRVGGDFAGSSLEVLDRDGEVDLLVGAWSATSPDGILAAGAAYLFTSGTF